MAAFQPRWHDATVTRGQFTMSIAITEDHRSLAETVRSFAEKRNLRGAARERLGSPDDSLPEFWSEFAELGWMGVFDVVEPTT